jgi:hypothetical protein
VRSAPRCSNGRNKSLDVATGKATAFILNLDQDTVRVRANSQAHRSSSLRELERILEEVHHN